MCLNPRPAGKRRAQKIGEAIESLVCLSIVDREGESDLHLRLVCGDEAYRRPPKSRAEVMEVVDKVNEEVQEEEMDHGVQSAEENASMDTEELGEGQQVGEDDEDELEEGEIADSDVEPGEVTEV